jgi:cysteine desulfurase
MIYLDYQATTPLAPEVAAAMRPWVEEKFANPHSPSKWGREAAAAIEVARDQIDRSLGLPGGRFAFTSGATEAINWAIKGTFEDNGRRKLVTVATEHAAVLDTAEWLEGKGIEVVRLQVGADGLVDLDMAEAVNGPRRSDAGEQRNRRDPACGRAGADGSPRRRANAVRCRAGVWPAAGT